jgi:hypothetical protein
MKQFFTLLFVLFVFSDRGFSQTKTRFSYLTVTLRSRHDFNFGGRYLELVTDKDNPNSAVIDSLVNYKTWPGSNTGTEFYYKRKDTSHVFFNYFRSVAECLEFLDDRDWQLFSVLGNTNGNSGNISTEPVYYFRREKRF